MIVMLSLRLMTFDDVLTWHEQWLPFQTLHLCQQRSAWPVRWSQINPLDSREHNQQQKSMRLPNLDHKSAFMPNTVTWPCFPPPTMSGSHSDSHMPYICSEQVPLTTKSSVTIGHPIRSREQMKGSKVFGSRPAITGSM